MNALQLWQDGRAALRAMWAFRHATLGQRVRVWGKLRVGNYGQMMIGDRVRLVSEPAALELVAGGNGRLEIGERTFINYGGSISAHQLVKIGPRCNIGPHVLLMDNNFHRLEPDRRDEMPPSRPIILEENVFLGARVIVLGGVTIGRDSVIGAGSVVTRDIPPGVIAAGNPAKVIRALEPEAEKRLEIRDWLNLQSPISNLQSAQIEEQLV
ncbi:MAG: acyltransferase [Candidatus Promineifilaceae bacterium]